ncbi:UTP--glucose-1-phosphate uridylyltransferase GalU [Oceanivirga miroungae]|uniref:UTP--glucose-1-phosphate uridylyltransferase n=1 Tax=Oceanivirga miroungae TaxID=1130046 RepID=A0A6I8M7X2_9FUSO|nr:UTP--glucose-1-phosphate uridylyltransferase GalU [Oceanivirga miroungae]VWL85508.1 UDP-glucose pyrophosphorylase [Oceanivirga miroungae]
MKKIRKAIIPAAGLGTRVLPATKAQAKEMLPILDKPAMQYLIEELVSSGITEILIITGRNKVSIENHFDVSYELEMQLEKKGKFEMLEEIDKISNMANIYYVRQKLPLGLGHAVLKAEAFVADEPFLVLLGDDIMYTADKKPVSLQLIEKYNELGKECSILGVQKVPKKDVNKYGIIEIEDHVDKNTFSVKNFIEKPDINEAPSEYAALGRYVLDPKIFKYLKNTKPGKSNEIQLTDAILDMLKHNNSLYAYEFDAIRYDTGDKLGLFKATVEFGLRNEELKDDIREYLKELGKKL